MCKRLIFLTSLVLVLGLFRSAAQARLLVYEPFDYASVGDPINGQYGEAIGLSNEWQILARGPGFVLVNDFGPFFGSLPTAGLAVMRESASGASSAHRLIDESIIFPSTTWFSVLLRIKQFDMGHYAFVISSKPLEGEDYRSNLASPGTAFGFNAEKDDPQQLVRAAIWSNSYAPTLSSDGLNVFTGRDIRFIVGKIEFDKEGRDILTLYDVGVDLQLPAPFATLEADVDQSLLNMVTIHGNREVGFDEIRIGGTLEDVLGLGSRIASEPNPPAQKTDVRRDVKLSWTPGEFANTHDVYLGTDFDDVNDADRTNPRGVLAMEGQIATMYDPPDLLDFGKTYFWRVDEVNAPPYSTIFEGNVWSFTVEPIAYPINANSITATASSSNSENEGPENTVNGLGLNGDDLHSAQGGDMWLSSIIGPQPTWIEYEFDKTYKLHQILVWNYNSTTEPVIGYGVKDATIEYSADGADWTTLGTGHKFAQGPGAAGYAPNTIVDLGGLAAKYVRITANSKWGNIVNQYGLSEVRFLYIPVFARGPNPASGTIDHDADNVTLSWRTGRGAAEHSVYLSTDEQTVVDGTAPAVTVSTNSYDTRELDLGQTYFWKIVEINPAEDTSTCESDLWNFATQEYLVVEGFEDYNDWPGHRVYEKWIDGWEVPTNGATLGYLEPLPVGGHILETTNVHGGEQSLPFFYDNSVAASSEATVNVADLQAGEDWSKHGIKGLTLRFFGDPNNDPQQMYVKINGAKVIYDGDIQNLKQTRWQMWYIDLATLSVNLSNVNQLSIGFERIGMLGGQGMILLDGIRLYSYERPLITPVAPDTANLVGHWTFDEGSGTTAADSSGNNNHGTITGAQWVSGQVGDALKFNGAEYIDIPPTAWSAVEKQVTIAFWAYGDPAALPVNSFVFGAFQDPATSTGRVASSHLPYGDGQIYFDTGGVAPASDDYDRISKVATPSEYEGSWQHWTFTKDADTGEQSIYLNGVLWHSGSGLTRTMGGAGVTGFTIACRPDHTLFYVGQIDDFRLYNRVLSPAEIAGLAGVTKPFDKPF